MFISLERAKYGRLWLVVLGRAVKSLKEDACGVLLGETALLWQLVYKF